MRTLVRLLHRVGVAAPTKAPRFPSATARLSLVATVVASACGGGQTHASPFDRGWVDDHGAGMATFQRSFRAVRVPLGADVAVGVIGATGLVGVPLGGGTPWTFTHVLHGRPAVAGSVVVGVGGGELFALEATTGALLWSRPSGSTIRGAGDDGTTTVISLLPATGFGSAVLAVARDGSVLRQIEAAADIGVPAVAGDTVFFPWRGRFLSAYDLLSGEERARLVLPDGVSSAFTLGGAVFAGEASLTRFDDRIGLVEQAAASTLALPAPLGGLPGDPAWMRRGTDSTRREADADVINLYARPTTTGTMAVEGSRFAAAYRGVALGLDASSGALVWAHAHGADFLGGAAYHGGFALCDAAGTITFLDGATGGVAARISLGRPVDACVVQADAHTRPSASSASSLVEQLTETLRLREARLAPVQQLLLRQLARLEDPDATRALRELAAGAAIAPQVREGALAALAGRP